LPAGLLTLLQALADLTRLLRGGAHAERESAR
jgi:hypothetical protein